MEILRAGKLYRATKHCQLSSRMPPGTVILVLKSVRAEYSEEIIKFHFLLGEEMFKYNVARFIFFGDRKWFEPVCVEGDSHDD